MSRLSSLGVLVAALLLSGVAAAQEDDGIKARQFFERGMGHFQLEEYAEAIAKWEAGFRIKPVPEFLYNIAQAYRLSKQPDKALSFYRKFLRAKPEAANRGEVEQHIRELQRVVSATERSATSPPMSPITPGKKRIDEPDQVEAAPPPAAATPQPAPSNVVEKKVDKEPVTKKKWFWPVIGTVAGVVVVTAVVVGVVVGTAGDSSPTLPGVSF